MGGGERGEGGVGGGAGAFAFCGAVGPGGVEEDEGEGLGEGGEGAGEWVGGWGGVRRVWVIDLVGGDYTVIFGCFGRGIWFCGC